MTEAVPTVAMLAAMGFMAGVLFILGAVVDAARRAKSRRFLAEHRRQARRHADALAATRRAHDAEIAALREAIRLERSAIRAHTAIEACAIEPRPLLNRDEFGLLLRLEVLAASLPNQQRLFSQVSLLEVFHARALNGDPKTRLAAFEAYKAFRVDFLVVNRRGYPVLGIEHQGSGHHHGNAAYRDQIKREVFRKAAVPLLEVAADYDWADVEARVREALRAPRLVAPPLAAE